MKLTTSFFRLSLIQGFLLFLGLILFNACESYDERTQFVLSYESESALSAPVVHTADSVYALSIPFAIDYEGDLEFKSTKKKKIEEVECFEVYVWIDDLSEARNLNHMENISFMIKAEGMEAIPLKSIDVQQNVGSMRINFSVKDQMKSILEKDKFELLLKYKSREDLQKNLILNGYIGFLVDSRKLFI